jgi:CBS domain containing-hemolysin-like protein
MLRYVLLFAIILTVVGTSFLCSLFESIILSTTIAEIEALKKTRPRRGAVLETLKREIDATISAILTLNTTANSLGSVAVGALAVHFYSTSVVLGISIGFGAVLLVFSEVLPKNIGVAHRRELQPYVVYPIAWMRRVLLPVTWLCALVVGPSSGRRRRCTGPARRSSSWRSGGPRRGRSRRASRASSRTRSPWTTSA